jgi:hypothetical protein
VHEQQSGSMSSCCWAPLTRSRTDMDTQHLRGAGRAPIVV